MIKVTFLLDVLGVLSEWTVLVDAVTLDLEFMHIVRCIMCDLLNRDVGIVRLEAVDKGVQVWMNVHM